MARIPLHVLRHLGWVRYDDVFEDAEGGQEYVGRHVAHGAIAWRKLEVWVPTVNVPSSDPRVALCGRHARLDIVDRPRVMRHVNRPAGHRGRLELGSSPKPLIHVQDRNWKWIAGYALDVLNQRNRDAWPLLSRLEYMVNSKSMN